MVSAQNDSLGKIKQKDLIFGETEFSAAVSPRFLMQSDLKRNICYDPLKTEINYPVLASVGGVFLGSGIAVHIYQRNAWWKDQRQAFHFVNDNNYALGMDKIGHFYAGNLLAHAFSSGLEAGNLTIEQSALYGSAASLLFELYVEIEDGYGPDWGFSPGDLAGDVLGAAFSLSQYYYPFLKNFQTRFSYIPSDKMRNGTHRGGNMIDDYEGQKYWLSFRMKNLLPEGVSNYWPSFLMLSVGMGVSNLDGSGGGIREFFVAFDLDAEEIPLYGKGWQFVKNTLNYFHFPMPGIRVSPDAVFFVICF
jgi:hypothetical protein